MDNEKDLSTVIQLSSSEEEAKEKSSVPEKENSIKFVAQFLIRKKATEALLPELIDKLKLTVVKQKINNNYKGFPSFNLVSLYLTKEDDFRTLLKYKNILQISNKIIPLFNFYNSYQNEVKRYYYVTSNKCPIETLEEFQIDGLVGLGPFRDTQTNQYLGKGWIFIKNLEPSQLNKLIRINDQHSITLELVREDKERYKPKHLSGKPNQFDQKNNTTKSCYRKKEPTTNDPNLINSNPISNTTE